MSLGVQLWDLKPKRDTWGMNRSLALFTTTRLRALMANRLHALLRRRH